MRCGRGRGRERHIIEEHMWWAYKGKNPTWCLGWLGLSKKRLLLPKNRVDRPAKRGTHRGLLAAAHTNDTQNCVHHHHMHVPRALCTLPPATSKHTDRRKLETQSNGSCNKQSNVISKNQVACSPLPSSPPQSAARDRRRQSSKRGGKGN